MNTTHLIQFFFFGASEAGAPTGRIRSMVGGGGGLIGPDGPIIGRVEE